MRISTPGRLDFPDDMTVDRLLRRSKLRDVLDGAAQPGERLAAAEAQYEAALQLLTSMEIRRAFDLTRESEQTRQDYGRTKIGQRCLLARRLVERGARFVMVDYGYDPQYGNLWDNHCAPSQNQPHICEIVRRGYHLAGMDQSFAALISDLRRRGLLDSTLVVFLTEFGRTPKINARGGRDHWGAAGSIFFAGGGARGGQVIGATDKHAAYPTGRGFTPGDVAATLYRALGIDPETRIEDLQNRPRYVLPKGQPIPGVLS